MITMLGAMMIEDRELEELAGIYGELNEENKKKVSNAAGILLTGQKALKEGRSTGNEVKGDTGFEYQAL
jgi:hypothetical protein